jgi:Zn finger protein HypA/HybF involved in hydrogenase expression
MCATCGCGVDLGSLEEVFAKNYRCQDCSLIFKGFGYKVRCPRCKSTNTKIAK